MPTPSPGYHLSDNEKLRGWVLRHLICPVLAGHEARLDALEAHMSLTDEALTELAGAIDEVAGELDALEAQVGESDADAATRIRAAADRLRGLRPDAPVEENPPAGDEGGPVSEPAPDQPAPADENDGSDAA